MNREKRDKIPSMQVSFIDAICIQLYEVGDPPVTLCLSRSECSCHHFPYVDVLSVADLGWAVGALLPTAGRLSEKPPALEAFG